MTTEDIIIQIFYFVDDEMGDLPKHPQANLYPSDTSDHWYLVRPQRRSLSGMLLLAEARLGRPICWLAFA